MILHNRNDRKRLHRLSPICQHWLVYMWPRKHATVLRRFCSASMIFCVRESHNQNVEIVFEILKSFFGLETLCSDYSFKPDSSCKRNIFHFFCQKCTNHVQIRPIFERDSDDFWPEIGRKQLCCGKTLEIIGQHTETCILQGGVQFVPEQENKLCLKTSIWRVIGISLLQQPRNSAW